MKLLPDSLRRDCRTDLPAWHHSGERSQGNIRYVVLHDPEAYLPDAGKSTAEAVSRYFMRPGSGGSANVTVDDFRCYRNLADTIVPWGAPPLNTHGWHIEIAGLARWKRVTWLLHRWTLRRAAYKTALRCRWYRIPARVLTAAELRKDFYDRFDGSTPVGLPGPMAGGIVTHATVTAAYHLSDHTDPGPGFPLDAFMGHLRGFLERPNL